MADGENSLGMAFTGASDMDAPVAKRPKISPPSHYGFPATKAEPLACVAGATESWETAGNCAHPAGKEAKPAMAVEQAPVALGGDNNGLGPLVSEPRRAAVKPDGSAELGAIAASAGTKGLFDEAGAFARLPVAPRAPRL